MSEREDAMDRLLGEVIACVEQVLGTSAVGPGTQLLERGDVDSIAIAELIAAIEEATGLELPPADIVPATFATPAAIARALAAGSGNGPAAVTGARW